MNRIVRLGICATSALLVLGVLEVFLVRAVLEQWQIVLAPGPESLPELVTLLALAVSAALGAWLAASTVAALLAHLPGRVGDAADRCARAWAPALCRRVAAVMVGAALGASLTPGTALADGQRGPAPSASALTPAFTVTVRSQVSAPDAAPAPVLAPVLAPALAHDPVPGWTPSRPVQRPQPESRLVTGGRTSRPTPEIVVHRGDTLWDLVRRQLGPDASAAEVADAWPAWYRANRAVIGDDPDLLLPGQVLRPPNPSSPPAAPSASGEPFGARR
ncbi:hypothetical protein BJ986_002204 [Phycicoccus badiiscoriae]|uniref:LysM domain-containing protein n=1 Tax=Pedococcus badiiscoriae TaxID=642776 RepID=A0A852WER2_9MICO|nr:hypothetical protein [Pedococcus badiiscoriae]NYG07717.1 hypothetical protein [Pedococcus badiiscoriae]